MHTHIRRNTIQYFLHFPQCMKYGHTDFPCMESLLVSNKLFIPRQTSYPQQRSFLVASWIVQSSNPTENHKIQTRGYLVLHALLFKLIFVLYSVHSSLLLLYRPISISVFSCPTFHCYRTLESKMHRCLQRTSKPSRPLFFNWCYPYHTTYIIVPNSLLSYTATNPTQRTHFRNTYLLNMSFFRPTFCIIQHSRSNHRPIKFAFQLLWYPLVI